MRTYVLTVATLTVILAIVSVIGVLEKMVDVVTGLTAAVTIVYLSAVLFALVDIRDAVAARRQSPSSIGTGFSASSARTPASTLSRLSQ